MARQRLGQHFLASVKVLERISRAVCTQKPELVVEIGPGKGALTQHLLRCSARVAAIELDPALAEYLRQRWVGEPRLEIVESDVMDTDWSRWGPGILAGNLPYYAATAIISRYVCEPGSLFEAVFLVQKEVAERITAKPGTRDFGYFSVECQTLTSVEYLFTVPPGAFQPPPKVDSALIRLIPRARQHEADLEAFLRFASACFRHKRKTLRNNLAGVVDREWLDRRPEASLRAEQLSAAELLELYRDHIGYARQ